MDVIKWEILEDGVISIETDRISGKNHQSADELLEQLARMMGGDVTVRHKKGHIHSHHHSDQKGGQQAGQ